MNILDELFAATWKVTGHCNVTMQTFAGGSILFVVERQGVASSWFFDSRFNEDKIEHMVYLMKQELGLNERQD